jgi:flagellar basal-body rod protein FlgG
MRALNVAATGMMAQQLFVETISNNIANMTTTGFKRRRPEFQDLLYQNQRRIGAQTSDVGTLVPAGVQIGLGVKPAAVYRTSRVTCRARRTASTSRSRARGCSSSSCPTARTATPAAVSSRSAPTASSSTPTATRCRRASRFPKRRSRSRSTPPASSR